VWQNIGYARVSSAEQAQGHSIENQTARLKESGCDRIITDVESAFKSKDRKGFRELMTIAEAGQVKQITVTNLDRFARNEAIAFVAFDLFEEQEIRLISLDQPHLDITHPDGRMMAGLSVLDARAYSARLRAKVRQGHKSHRDRNAAYFAPFAYQVVDERFELDHAPFLCLLEDRRTLSKAAIGRDIIENFLKFRSLRRTLAALNTKYGITSHVTPGSGNRRGRGMLHFHPSGLTSWLNNPILRGHTCYGRSAKQRMKYKHLWDLRLDTHSNHRLMSDEEYCQIEEILDYNSKHGGYSFKSKILHPLSGLVYCNACRGACHSTSFRLRTDPSIKKYSYQCTNYRYKACLQKASIREEKLEAAVIEALTQRAEAIAAETDELELIPVSPQLAELKQQLEVLEGMGDNPAIIAAREDIRLQISALRQQEAQHSQEVAVRRTDMERIFKKPDFWEGMSSEEKQKLFRWLVRRMFIQDGRIISIELRC
jgi:site-specific DNA recombinase